MKPSRAPVPDKPHPPPPIHRPNPAETRLWALLDTGDPSCPWCGEPAQRVVKVAKTYSLSCWLDHLVEEDRHAPT